MTPAADDPSRNDRWREKVKRWFVYALLGREAMMWSKINRQNRIARELAIRAANGTLRQMGDGSMSEPDDDIRIGDEVHYHCRSSEETARRQWTKWALIAGSLLGVPGAVGLGYWLGSKPAAAPVEQPAVDEDIKFHPGGVKVESFRVEDQ